MSWFILTAICCLAGLAAIFPALMTPMMFDSPGSTSNPVTVGLVVSIGLFPLVCFIAAVLPWIFRHWSNAKWLFALPLLDLGIIILLFIALSHFYGGSFGGQHSR